MKLRHAFLALAAALALPALAAAEAPVYTLDTAHTNVGFSVRHFLTQVPGRFSEFGGTIAYDPANPTQATVEVTVQAASINTGNDQRDGHLRSPDFFDVEKFPTLSFKSTKIEAGSGDQLMVTGDFTLHGVTKSITVPVDVLGVMGEKAGFSTSFTIDRKDYGIVWNRALDQGGTILGDDVKVQIDIEANLEKAEGAK